MLAAILRQNPRFHASVSTPLADLTANLIRAMSEHEGAALISSEQREQMARALVDAYYSGMAEKVVFDTSRRWCAMLPLAAMLFPGARVICCLRSPSWIIDSVERAIQRNPLLAPRMFGHEITTVYQRTEKMIKDSMIAGSMGALRQAWFSEHASRLIAVRYDSLCRDPGAVIDALYRELGEPRFAHDFENLDYDAPEFDASLGVPGFHRVFGSVMAEKRDTILPSDIFNQYNEEFWESPEENPRNVTIL
jgi:sulfotransferase